MSNPIHIVSAVEGKIEMRLQDNTILPLTDDPKMIALAVGCHGVEGWFTTSMDFADEHGFARPNAARELFAQGMKLAAEHENVDLPDLHPDQLRAARMLVVETRDEL
jgi:hypothetical protein